jgi:hypothetical protein
MVAGRNIAKNVVAGSWLAYQLTIDFYRRADQLRRE